MKILLQSSIIPLICCAAVGICCVIYSKLGKTLKFPKTLIFLVCIIVTALCIFIFNPSFFTEQPLSDALSAIILTPLICFIAGAVIYTIIDILLKSFSDENVLPIAFTAAVICFIIITVYNCQPITGTKQYYVNIYNSNTDNECVVGYVEMNYDKDGYTFDTLYLTDTKPLSVTGANGIDKINLKSREKYNITVSNDVEYWIEFIKEKN